MNVLELVSATFPGCTIAPENLGSLAGMPVESNCGDDCKQAIETAGAFAYLVRDAHGRYATPKVQPICDAAVALCITYICG